MQVPRRVYLFLALGLVAASQSGNIIRIGDAHPVVMAAWRLLIASSLLAPIAGTRLAEMKRINRVEAVLLAVAGTALALHFFAWIAAVQLTKVANAAIFFSINPVITAVAGHFVFGERITPKLSMSIALGVAGVVSIGWSDLNLSPENLAGDGAALVCSLLFTAYFLIGKRLRRVLSTSTFAVGVYSTAAIFSFVVAIFMRLPAFDYSARTWICFVLMALVPTMIGHTSFANALRYIDASRISVATLSEPVLAGLVAYFAWGEKIATGTVLGYMLICASVIVLILDRKTESAPVAGEQRSST